MLIGGWQGITLQVAKVPPLHVAYVWALAHVGKVFVGELTQPLPRRV